MMQAIEQSRASVDEWREPACPHEKYNVPRRIAGIYTFQQFVGDRSVVLGTQESIDVFLGCPNTPQSFGREEIIRPLAPLHDVPHQFRKGDEDGRTIVILFERKCEKTDMPAKRELVLWIVPKDRERHVAMRSDPHRIGHEIVFELLKVLL
jgi:hypothetical protein